MEPCREPVRVLLVEDNGPTGDALSQVFELEGLEVRWIRSAAAIELLSGAIARGEAAPPDVIVLDLLLPDRTPGDLVREVAAAGFGAGTIIHSAAADRLIEWAADRLGATAAFRKPADCDALVREVRRAAFRAEPRGRSA